MNGRSHLGQSCKAKLTAISSTTAFTSEKDETINGIRGRSFEASMIGPTRAEYWLVWVGEHNGYSYELVFVGGTLSTPKKSVKRVATFVTE